MVTCTPSGRRGDVSVALARFTAERAEPRPRLPAFARSPEPRRAHVPRRRPCPCPFRPPRRRVPSSGVSVRSLPISPRLRPAAPILACATVWTTHAHASPRCVASAALLGGQGVSREYVRARMRAAEELDRPIWAKAKRPPYHWSRNGGGHLPAHHASMFCLFRGPSSLPLRPRSIGRSTCRGCSRCSLVSRLRARKDMPQLS